MAAVYGGAPPPGLLSQQYPPPLLSQQYPPPLLSQQYPPPLLSQQHPPPLLSQQYPPPLLPKPGKDNVRLQKLLKRTAKKKSSTQTSQSAVPFRSSLSPVNEASPDLERSDNSTPPKTPETPFTLHGIQPAPRFTVRPLYQHVASPYPQRAAYGRAASVSPQALATPSYSYSQDFSTSSSTSVPLSAVPPAPGRVDQPTVPRRVPPEAAVVPELQKPVSSKPSEFPAGGSTPSKPRSPGPTPYSSAGAQVVIRPLTVLTPIVKSKSPRPNFKATEPSRSPKPMFDVPQIRMYTASTSYYETSRTPPVYDTAALTAIGSTVPRSKTPAETKQDEAGRGTTPTPQPSSSGTDSQSKAATSDATTTAAASKVETTVPPLETTTPDVRSPSPTPDANRATSTSDVKIAVPSSVIRVKTPTYEFEMSRITAGRPRTPARASTPAFEVSRPNPLLFAVTPITVEPERSSTSQTLPAASSSSVSHSVKITEAPEALLNGDTHSDVTPAANPAPQSLEKPKPESDSTKETTRAAPVGVLTSSQRPKTPTYEASRLLSTSPGYKRPKTPTYGTPRSGVSPVAFQRPKTPTHMTQRSSYRGLTPAEYAAYGGIKTYSPAFGIGGAMTSTQEEVKPSETPSQGPAVTGHSTVEGSQTKGGGQPQQVEEKAAPIPTIVVSQASESSGKTVTKGTISHQVAARQETMSAEETPTVQSQTTAAEETKAKAPEAMRPSSKEQDPLKAVKKLLGKDKVQTTEQQQKESKSEVLKQKEAAAATTTKDLPAAPVKTKPADAAEDKGKDQKVEAASSVTSASDNKEGETPAPAEPLLKVLQKPKGMKAKASGWSRLKKHMVVEQEEPRFPEAEPQSQAGEQRQKEERQQDEKVVDEKASAQDDRQTSGSPKATKMWDAVLFQMFSSKENIMHQIELSKSETEQSEDVTADESKDIPSFAFRLPVLLFSPKFDAKKLKEAASRPVTKISTVFEMGLIGRKGKEEEPKDFNRTARGFRNM